jgi:predicted transcriptional regulator
MVQSVNYKNEDYKIHFSNPPFLVKMCGEFNRFLPIHKSITGETMIINANDFNKYIGIKIKEKRLEKKLTQTKLGNKLGVTFQQVQKYEKGINGVSAFRLNQLSRILNVPINYFFEYLDIPLILTKEMEVTNDKSSSR